MTLDDAKSAKESFKTHPIMGPATKYLCDYIEIVSRSADEWIYVGPLSRPANSLTALVTDAMMNGFHPSPYYKAPTWCEVVKATNIIKKYMEENSDYFNNQTIKLEEIPLCFV